MKVLKRVLNLALVVVMLMGNGVTVLAQETQETQEAKETVTQEESAYAAMRVDYEKMLDYIYIHMPRISRDETQYIVVSLSNKTANVTAAKLTLMNEKGNAFSLDNYTYKEGLILFETQQDIGTYQVDDLTLTIDEQEIGVDLDSEDIYADFQVVEEGTDETNSEVEMLVQVANPDGSVEEVSSIEEGIAQLDVQESKSVRSGIGLLSHNGNKVIMLDPGHDKTHGSNSGNGIIESEYNLMIAKACRTELRKYPNVEVYLTVKEDGSCYWPHLESAKCNEERTKYAKSKGADIFVSMHLNIAGSSANGAEVFISNHSSFNKTGKELAGKILAELQKLGLGNRGIKTTSTGGYYPDGTPEDSYIVIKNCALQGLPAILVEHGFMTNVHDANIIKNNVTAIGQADARSIAAQLGLSRGPETTVNSVTVSGLNTKNQITITANATTTDKNLVYTFQVNDGSGWKNIATQTTARSVIWTPAKAGQASVCVYAKGAGGSVGNKVVSVNVPALTKTTTVNSISASGLNSQGQMTLTANATSNDTNLVYTFQVNEGGGWKNIATQTTSKTIVWKPTKAGQASVCVYAKGAGGSVGNKIVSVNVPALTPRTTTVNSISASGLNSQGQITLTANATSNDTNLVYTFQVNEGGGWKNIATLTTAKSVVWKPTKAGSASICVYAKGASGSLGNKIISVNVPALTPQTTTVNSISASGFNSQGQITLTANVTSNDTNLVYTFQADEGNGWKNIATQITSKTVVWKPTKAGVISLCVYAKGASGSLGMRMRVVHPIMGTSNVTVNQMVKYYQANNSVYDQFSKYSAQNNSLSRGGAPNITQFCTIFLEEAKAEGVKAEVAFAQTMHETNFLKFTGDVQPWQYNYAGLGATGDGKPGERFTSVRIGIRAQIQHLKAYASTAPLNKDRVDNRFNYVKRGSSSMIEGLAGSWAADSNYGVHLVAKLNALMSY